MTGERIRVGLSQVGHRYSESARADREVTGWPVTGTTTTSRRRKRSLFKGPPPPPPPPAAAITAAASSSIDTKEEKALIAAGTIPLTDAMKEVLKTEPKDKFLQQDVGLKDNDDVLDYLQEVINKISEVEEFMKDFENSKGSGKIKFYNKYFKISALFKFNNITKIKQTAWNMFLDTNENLKTDFENEPEPVKEVKKVDVEKLQKSSEKAKGKSYRC